MSDRTIDLRVALFERLSTDATIQSLVSTRIYDNVPQRTDYPYITISENVVNDYSDKGEDDIDPDTDGQEHFPVINVYDRSPESRGQKKINEILSRVRSLLHCRDLFLDGVQLTYLIRYETSFVRQDPDTTSWHGYARYRALTT